MLLFMEKERQVMTKHLCFLTWKDGSRIQLLQDVCTFAMNRELISSLVTFEANEKEKKRLKVEEI